MIIKLPFMLTFFLLNTAFAQQELKSKQIEFENAKLENQVHHQFSEETLLIKPVPDPARYKRDFDFSPYFKVVRGEVSGFAFSVPKNYSPLQIFEALRDRLKGNGFEVKFACTPQKCGANKESSYTQGYTFKEKTTAGKLKFYDGSFDIAYVLTAVKETEAERQWLTIFVSSAFGRPRYHAMFVDEKAQPKNTVKFEDAQSISDSIEKTGKAVLYGIYFDTNQAVLKSEAKSTLEQIAKYLKDHPKARIIVTGHTDSQGEFGYNVKLSNSRAQAVVDHLTKVQHVAPERLLPFGAGRAAPVSINDTDQGRALNRRVELVKW